MKKQYFLNANIIDTHNSLNEVGGLIIDENGLVKELINILGLSAKMIKSDDEVQEIRANRQEQQMQQAQMQQALEESQVAKNAAPAVKAINETNKR